MKKKAGSSRLFCVRGPVEGEELVSENRSLSRIEGKVRELLENFAFSGPILLKYEEM